MAHEPHNKTTYTTTPAPQQRILRALVGSLVFCAAFASTVAAQGSLTASRRAPQVWAQIADRSVIDDRPFRELLAEARHAFGSGEVKAQDTFDISYGATLASDGTLRNVEALKIVGSPRWQQLAREFMSALSESHALSSLGDADHLTLSLKLDGAAFARLIADVPTEAQAKSLADGYNALIAVARMSRAAGEGVVVLNNMTASANGKQFALRLDMSREELGNLLSTNLSLP